MQNWERQKFEDNWKSAFEGAEMTAPDSVWKTIEVGLSGEESNKMRRRVVFYQRLATAMVIFALLSGIYAFYWTSSKDDQVSSASRTKEPTDARRNDPVTSNETPPENTSTKVPSNQIESAASSREMGKSQGASQNHFARRSPTNENAGVFSKENETGLNDGHGNPVWINPDSLKLESLEVVTKSLIDPNENMQNLPRDKKDEPEETVNNAVLLTAEQINAIAEAQNNKKEKERPEGLWLGMGASAGNYSPEGVQSSGLRAADAGLAANRGSSSASLSRRNSAGSSFSFGLAVGKKISKKWIIQSGINYVTQQIDHTSNFADISSSNQAKAMVAEYFDVSNNYGVVSIATPNPVSMTSSTTVSLTAPYTVNSNIEIVSVPVQAGYLFVDRKVGFQMNAGVSSDFFVRNTLVDKSGSVSRFSQGAGESSPYRSVILSGLLSTEVSYKFGNHYRLSLVPGMRYSFQSALKDHSGTGTPLVLDVGFRFKYIFR